MPVSTKWFTGRRLLWAAVFTFLCFPVFAYSGSKPYPSDNSLAFTENKNQWHPAVKFAAPLHGGRLFLKNNGFTFAFYNLPDYHHAGEAGIKLKGHAYNVTFLKASDQVKIKGEKQTKGYSNYYLGNNPQNWASKVLSYQQTTYSDLYPGINLQLYQAGKNLKYDFIVAPGSSPAVIKMQYDGQENISLENGSLHLKTSVRSVTEQKPYAYQLINGKEVAVPCNFKLEKNVVSFDFPKGYDNRYELIIDPVLVFSSYTGSTADNWGFTATHDSVGNMYAGGIVFSIGFPTTPGAFDQSYNGSLLAVTVDIGIIKYNTAATGTQSRLYATYLGGTENDLPHSMVVNGNEELLILGTTGSANYPVTTGVYDNLFSGGPTTTSPIGVPGFLDYLSGSDIFISKLNADGTALLASTFLGGTGNDGFLNIGDPLVRNYGDQYRGDIAVDAADNVYIASSTASANYPTPGGFQTSFSGGVADGVISKLNPNLSALLWSSFIGGTGVDAVFSVRADATGNVYIAGGTTSPTLPGTAGSFKPAYTGSTDGYVAKINSSGSLVRTSYIGTTSYDQVYFVQLDGNANVYLLGQTAGNYPVSPPPGGGSFYSVPNSRQFIHKLNTDLTASIFSTTFGAPNGEINISPTAFLVDDCERIYACGWGGTTNSQLSGYNGGFTTGMPVTADAFKPNTDGSDFYLIQLSQHAAALEYATFFGGTTPSGDHVDGGTSRFDKRGFVYQSVCASCQGLPNDFPTTPGAWSQTNNSTNCNNAAFKFNFEVSASVAGTSQRVCSNQGAFQLTGATPAGGIWSGNGVTPTGLFTPSGLSGPQTLTYTVTNGNCVSTSFKTVTVKPVPTISFTGLDSAYCSTASPVTLIGLPAGGTFSGPGVTGNIFEPDAAPAGTHTITYTYITPDTCTTSISKTVIITPIGIADAGADESVCADDQPFQLTSATPAGGVWSGPGVTPTGLFTPTGLSGPQTLTYTLTNGNCTTSSQKTIIVNQVPQPVISGLAPLYCANAAAVTLTGSPAGGTFSGPGITGNTFNPAEAGNGNHTITYLYTSPENCTASISQTVEVSGAATIIANANLPECAIGNSISGLVPLAVNFSNATVGATTYRWDFGDGSFSDEMAPAHTYTMAGTFTVTLTTDPGTPCAASQPVATFTTVSPFMPNIITPNNDLLNDTFEPVITCLPATLQVFNRWGSKVYEQKNYDQTWNGDNLADGIYYYLLTDTSGRKWKGWLEIIR